MADKVNYCRKPAYNEFGMRWCAAPRFKDQKECKYYGPSSVSKLCMHFRRNIERHCDSLTAQKDSTTATTGEKGMRARTEKERERREEEEARVAMAKAAKEEEKKKEAKYPGAEQIEKFIDKMGKKP